MFGKKKTECRVCGYRFTPERENIYTAEEPRSMADMLTLCADGFRRLIIKKENDMATPYKECPHCGAHLDSGEKCDCRAAEADGNAEKELKERTKDNDN